MPPKKTANKIRKSVAASKKGSQEKINEKPQLSNKSGSRYEVDGENFDGNESVVQQLEEVKAEDQIIEQPGQQEELENADHIMEDALNNEDEIDDESLKQKTTIETKGLNLGENIDEVVNKSMAMTEMIKPPGSDDNFYDKNNEYFEKYTDVNQDQIKDERTDLDNLGFMDEEIDIQPTELSKNIKQVQGSWAKFEKIGLNKCGEALMKNIFKIDPKLLLLFSFKTEPQIYKSQKFKDHALKVINAVGMAVQGLDDLESLIPMLKGLGKNHVNRGVLPQHYPIVGQALVTTLKSGLKYDWTQETEEAWKSIFQIIQDTMISDHYDQIDESDMQLTQNRIRLVQNTWKQIITSEETYQPIGILILKQFFEFEPDAVNALGFQHFDNLYDNFAVKMYAQDLIRILDLSISSLYDYNAIEGALKQFGKTKQRDFTANNLTALCKSIMEIFQAEIGKLGPDWTLEVKQAWFCALDKMTKTMRGDIMDFPRAGDETVLDDTQRNDDSLRGLIGEDNEGDSMMDIPNRKKNKGDASKNELGEDDDIKEHYLQRFRKEVDFHHKIAYRFEKAYRLGKKMSDKKQSLNLDIIDCISEHSGYIEQDPMALFYSLFFCIYYRNEDLVEFLRTLIHKIHNHDKIDKLLEYIDVNGIERLRTVGDQINAVVYHMVFYQAIDDDLRIVYAQIFRQLKFIQMRDKDALQFLNQRDYELIKLSFTKSTSKLKLTLFFKKDFPMKSSTYRKYNQAYYEEVVINNNVEQRVAQNYRERFLVSAEDIYIVFQMYCKEDYDEQFQKTKKEEITHQEFIELFIICIRNDSFKIGILLYTLFLNPQHDMDNKMMDILMSSIKESVYYHEMKLFLLHEHFDVLTIFQLNQLVDIYQEILHNKESKLNPIVNQFNTIKISMLIYRICFKIEEKQIYSLITKCSLLKSYLINSLSTYFEKQNNILVLYKLMSEPILHMTERKDSLDIMFEMNMQDLLKNPVVVEVLNLVYEGKYSVSSSALSMSQTFFCLLEMEVTNVKSINERLLQNIVNVGDLGTAKQTQLQYHIWKQSIQRREIDEMAFSVMINGLIIGIAIYINSILNSSYSYIKETFGGPFGYRTGLLINAKPEVLQGFCAGEVSHILEEYYVVKGFYMLMVLTMIGMTASVIQKLVSFRYKDNVTLNFTQILLEFSIAITSIIFIIMFNNHNYNTLISDVCGKYTEMDEVTKENVNHMYTMSNPRKGELDFRLILSVIIVQSSTICIMMLQRTQFLGELIMMLTMMQTELIKFFSTFGLLILIFVFLGRFLSTELKFESATFFEIILDLFNAFNGNQQFSEFTEPVGQSFIGVFMFLFRILFMSLLAAMFINKYKIVWRNLDAYKRFNIIKMKNSICFDKFIGGITLSFFPINILMIPFIPPIIFFRNPRASDFLLKCQYGVMMVAYCILSGVFIIPLTPILYIKLLLNSMFIANSNVRQAYKGQNIVQLISAIFLGPIFISLSLIIDFVTLPNILLKDSRDFEHKYQLSTDSLNDVQVDVVMATFTKIFYGTNFEKFKGTHMTLLELMEMHTTIFKIIDNLHILFCRGTKDAKEALSNVQDYNMTKILTKKCSIPDRGGDFKQGKCELDVIHAVQMDIEMFNYVDIILRKLRLNKLEADVKKKSSNKADEELKEEHVVVNNAEGNQDDDDDETKKIDGISAILIGPDGIPLKRNNSDVMNNFYIQFVCQSFTDIESQLKDLRTNKNHAREAKMKKVVADQKSNWKSQTVDHFEIQANKFTNFVRRELGIKTQTTEPDSTKESDPQNHKDGSNEAKNESNKLKGNKTMVEKKGKSEKNLKVATKNDTNVKKSKTQKK